MKLEANVFHVCVRRKFKEGHEPYQIVSVQAFYQHNTIKMNLGRLKTIEIEQLVMNGTQYFQYGLKFINKIWFLYLNRCRLH